jgi:methyl-accepting chemotaxis protein
VGVIAEGAQQQVMRLSMMLTGVLNVDFSVRGVADASAQAREVATGALAEAHSSGAAVRKSISTISEIGHAFDKMNKSINGVESIAAQINILSLNAAIEAARAGVHGASFAVVAAEVRKLAGEARRQSDALRSLVNESVARISEGVEQSKSAQESLQRILEGIEATANHVESIASATREQAQTVAQVSQQVQDVASAEERQAQLIQRWYEGA